MINFVQLPAKVNDFFPSFEKSLDGFILNVKDSTDESLDQLPHPIKCPVALLLYDHQHLASLITAPHMQEKGIQEKKMKRIKSEDSIR